MITISLPIAVLFFARAIDGLTGGNVSVADASFQMFHSIKIGAKILEKWRYPQLWALLLDPH
jgi:HD-like signal output (HDOD) protein